VLEADDFVPLVAETGDSRERFERLLSHLMQRRVDAVITSAVHLDGAEMLGRLLGDVPVVLAVRGLPHTDYNTVRHDDVTGGALAAGHLASLGHRRVGQLAGPIDIDAFIRRADGFSAAVAAAGLEEIVAPAPGSVTPTFIEGRRLTAALLDAPIPPTGVFAPSDVTAVDAIDARGLRCREDVSVVGYNDPGVRGRMVQLPARLIVRRSTGAAG
jgi:LacI family transcriptional regulator